METFKDYSNTQAHLTSIRNKPQQQQHGELSAPILAQTVMLVNLYSYCMMVKVSCCYMCMGVEFCQIQSHNYWVSFIQWLINIFTDSTGYKIRCSHDSLVSVKLIYKGINDVLGFAWECQAFTTAT